MVVDGSRGCTDGSMIVGNGLKGESTEIVRETRPGQIRIGRGVGAGGRCITVARDVGACTGGEGVGGRPFGGGNVEFIGACVLEVLVLSVVNWHSEIKGLPATDAPTFSHRVLAKTTWF